MTKKCRNFGAGSSGQQLQQALEKVASIQVIAFIDEDKNLNKQKIGSVTVYCRDRFNQLIKQHNVTEFYIAMPDRFEKQVAFMDAHTDIAASSGFIEKFNDEGVVLSRRVLPLAHKDLVDFAKKRSPLSHPAVIFRKEVILDVGGYPELYPENYLLWVKLIQGGHKISNIHSVLLMMRTGEEFIARRGWRFLKGELKIHRHMYQTGYISLPEYLKVIVLKALLRLAPGKLKKLAYRLAR